MNALEEYSTCSGYPYDNYMRHRPTKSGLVVIGDYVFDLYKISEKGVSYGGIATVFIKIDIKNTDGGNRGTKIKSGSTATWHCHSDDYLQKTTKSGGSTAYNSTNTKVYNANSACGKTVIIN